MSKQVDERVVSMQFDNKHFESNVKTTMSTLDKLKEKLNLNGAAKSLESVNVAAKNCNMSGLAKGVETVSAKFSALQVMGVTALANITNSAINAGKRIAASLTIEPIKTGFNEYELKMDSVRTIMASTGESVQTVNKYLNELNEYSDQTIYSFADMTQNIGKFTNAGVKLEDAVMAIKGISNEAAVSGANANEASRAMYNFAQALSAGHVKLIDWKSIENANMATVEFKNELIRTAVEMGTITKAGDGMYKTLDGNVFNATKNFNEVLKDQWMTSDVLVETLKDYADNTTEIGKKAFSAAQDVTKFTQMLDVLKETAQSGWARTWELIFGNIEQAKSIFTPLTTFFSGIIDSMSDFRNKLIEGAMGSPFGKLAEKIKSVTGVTDDMKKAVEAASKPLKDLNEIVNKVIRGDFGNGLERVKKLTDAGYEYATVQDKVNEKLGNSYRHSKNAAEAQKKVKATQEEVTKAQAKNVEQLLKMSDAQLKSVGFTNDEIKALRELEEACDKAGISVSDFLKDTSLLEGRTLLINSFKNAGSGLIGIFKSMKDAWVEIFPPPTSDMLYNLIAGLHKFSQKLRLTEEKSGKLNETGKKLKRTFKGVFALLDIITTVVGGPVKIALKLFAKLLGAMDLDILDVTASIGDAIVKFRDWIDSVIDFNGIFEKVAPYVKKMAEAIKEWVDKAATAIKDFAKAAAESEVGQNIISGLINGLKSGATTVYNAILEIGKKLVTTICNFLGIESPSKKFFEIGENVIAGLVNGLKSAINTVIEVGKTIVSKLTSVFERLDLSKLADVFTNLVKIFPQLRILNVFSGLAGLFKTAGGDITAGLAGGIGEGASTVLDMIGNLANKVISWFQSILGIESPSKVFWAIGGFIIAGLVGGLLGGTGNVLDAFKTIGNTIIDFFKNLDMTTAISIGSIIGTLLLLKKALDIVDKFANFADGIGGLGKSLKGLVDNISAGFKPSKWTIVSNAILKIAGALAILVAAVWLLTTLDVGKMWIAYGCIAALLALIAALGTAILYYGAILDEEQVKNINKLSNVLLKIAGVFAIMAVVTKILGKMSDIELKRGAQCLVAFTGIIAALMAVTKLISAGENVDKIGGTLVKVAGAFLLMAIVAKIAARMSWEDMAKAGVAIAGFTAIIIALMWATKLLTAWGNVDAIGGTLMKAAGAMLIMALVAKIAASMSLEEMLKGGAAIAGFTVIIVGLMWATKLLTSGPNVGKIGGTLMAVAGVMLAMVLVAKIAASMSPSELIKGVAAVAAFGFIIIGLIGATQMLTTNDFGGLGLTLLGVASAMLVMGIVTKIMATMSLKDIAKGTIAVTAFAGIIVGLIAATKLAAGTEIDKLGKTLLMISGAIAILGLTVAALSFIPAERLAIATACMGALMGLFALVILVAGKAQASFGPLIVITLAIAVMATAIRVIGALDVKNAIGAAASLGGLMLVLTGVLVILSKIHTNIKNVALGVVGLLALCVPLAALVYALSLMKDVQNASTNAMALAGLATVLSILLLPLSLVGMIVSSTGGTALLGIVGLLAMAVPLIALVGVLAVMQNVKNAAENARILSEFATVLTILLIPLTIVGLLYTATAGLAALGIAGLLAMVIPLFALVGVLAVMQNIQGAEENTKILTGLLTKMTDVLVVLSIIGPLAMVGVTAMSYLTGLMIAIGALAIAVGALMQKFPAIQSLLDTGIPVLIQLAGGIGEMLGAFVGGIATQIVSTLPAIGVGLSMFMTGVMPFVNGVKMVDASVLTGVGILAAAIIALTAADLIAGVASFVQGGSSFADLGTELSNFMTNALPFIMGSSMIRPEIMTGVKSLAEAILILTGANLIEGLTRLFGGESSLSYFGAQLGQLGTDLSTFVTNLGTFSDDQVTTVSCAGKAIKNLANAAKDIPNDGGWLAAICGENSIATFGENLPPLANHLRSFVDELGTFSEEQVTTVDCAGKAIKALAKAAGEIPNEGGLWATICGDNSLATFGDDLPTLGSGLRDFVDNLGTFEDKQVTTVDCAGRAVKALADAASKIPNEGGWAAKIFGENGLGAFSEKLPPLAKDLKDFVGNLGEFSDGSIDTVKSAVSVIKVLATISEKGMKLDHITDLGSKMVKFAKKLKSFGTEMADIDSESIASATGKIKDLLAAVKDLSSADADAVKNLGDALKSAGKKSIQKFIDAFDDASSDVKSAAVDTMNTFVKGMESKIKAVKSSAKSIASDGAAALKEKRDSFYNAGSYLVSGFANGISENSYKATAKARAMAKAAADAAEDELDINSPSKVFRAIGYSVPEGFAMGIDRMSNLVTASSKDMAVAAVGTVKSAIARVSDIVNGDIDTQPTIRPVMDLSDVSAGVGAINGMLGFTPSVGVLSNVRAINSMMNRNQNGTNKDVVSAIKDLEATIGKTSGDRYEINGITYSEGSDVSEAVKTLVRAVTVGGRK